MSDIDLTSCVGTPQHEESLATPHLRWVEKANLVRDENGVLTQTGTRFTLQQKWLVPEGLAMVEEWRDVPTVREKWRKDGDGHWHRTYGKRSKERRNQETALAAALTKAKRSDARR